MDWGIHKACKAFLWEITILVLIITSDYELKGTFFGWQIQYKFKNETMIILIVSNCS